METGILKAVRLAGSQTSLGNLLGLTPQAVQKWVAQGVVPGNRCLEVEKKLGGKVTRYELNPAVFGNDPALRASPAPQPDDVNARTQPYSRRKDDSPATVLT